MTRGRRAAGIAGNPKRESLETMKKRTRVSQGLEARVEKVISVMVELTFYERQ